MMGNHLRYYHQPLFAGQLQCISTWTIHPPALSSALTSAAASLCGHDQPLCGQEGSRAAARVAEAGQENRSLYTGLVASLCQLVEGGARLHRPHLHTALTMLCTLVRSDLPLPAPAVRVFTTNLVHDNILVRRASILVIDCVLKQHKRKHLKLQLPSQWLETPDPELHPPRGHDLEYSSEPPVCPRVSGPSCQDLLSTHHQEHGQQCSSDHEEEGCSSTGGQDTLCFPVYEDICKVTMV